MNGAGWIDVSAWTGSWNTLAVDGDVAVVRRRLLACGVSEIHLAPLDSVWGHNLHLGNRAVYAAADIYGDIRPVPLLDPTLPTWPQELEIARHRGDVAVIRWLPSYSAFDPSDACANDCARAIETAGFVLSVQVRIEDERRNHPRARVTDTPLAAVIELAQRHPQLPVIIGGSSWKPILDAAEAILDCEHLYAETSQIDGIDSLLMMRAAGLTPRLLFGTHTPLFTPLAGIARIAIDVDEQTCQAILRDNALRLFGA